MTSEIEPSAVPPPAALRGPNPPIRLLTSPGLWRPDGQLQVLPPLDAALLAILVLQGPTPRSTLASLLWSQRPQAQALTNLRQRLRQLRLVLPGLHAPAGGAVALVPVPAVAAHAPPETHRPGRGSPQARSAPQVPSPPGPRPANDPLHDLEDPLSTLERDPDALDGPLLGRHDYADTPALAAWVRQARASWAARLRDAHAELANRHEAAGRIAPALRHATRLVRDEPTNEHGVRLLMRLHYRRGDRGAALAAYERCVQALHDQFGEAVSDETARLGEAIARHAQEAPTPVRAMPVVLRHPPVMVGRDALMSVAEQRWTGQRVVLLAGPPGIGKSRLLAELCRRSDTSQAVRLGPDDAMAPLGLLLRLMRQLSGHWPTSGTAASLAFDLEQLLVAAAAHDPVHLAIEDLHFADAESLAALVRLLPPAGPPRVYWWLTTRNHPLPAPLESWLGRHEDLQLLLELPEWSSAQVVQFLGSLVGGAVIDLDAWGQALQRHCGGHPLHLLWVLRALHEQGTWGQAQPPEHLPRPVEMKALVARRLDGSDALTQQIAFVGALAGADFDAALVARVTGRRASELAVHWRRLEAQGILRGRGFSHELMRQAVLEAVPEALRPLLHEEIALALPDQEGVHERRGAHWQAAGHPVRAAADLARAAEEALIRGLPTRALDLLSRAELLEAAHGDPDRLFDLRWRSARLAVAWDTVVRALGLAALLLESARDDRQRSLALSMRAFARAEQHDTAALEDAEQALSLAWACNDPTAQVQALLRRAQALHVAGRTVDALALLQGLRDAPPRALSTQEAHDLEDTLCLVLAALGRRREVVALAEAAGAAAQANDQWQRAAEMASIAGVNLCYLGQLSRSIAACEQSLAWCRRIGADRGSVFVDMMTLAGLYLDAGRFDEAVTMGEAAADGLREAGLTGWIANAEHSLASMFMILGRHDLTARHLADLPDDAPLWTRAAREMLRGVQIYLRGGDSPLAHLLRAQAMFRQVGAGIGPFVHHRINAEIAAWIPVADALPQLADAEAWARSQEHVTLRRVVRRLRIDVLLKDGQFDAAVAAADALEADFAGQWEAVNFYLPDVWRSLVRAWDAGGQIRRADALAAHALNWVQDRWRTHVPAAFRDTFLQGNRTNRWLLERTGVGRPGSS